MTPTRHAEEAVNLAHPLRVATGQVVVDRDDVDALALERVQIGGQRGDERLAFAGLHLGDAARSGARRRQSAGRRSAAC